MKTLGISLGENGDMFVDHMLKMLTSQKNPEVKRVVERLLKKTNNPQKFFEAIKLENKEILEYAFGKGYLKTINHLEKHFAREDVRGAMARVQEIIRKHGPNGEFDVVAAVKQISSLPKELQMQMFGVSRGKLISNFNHLFNHMKIESRGRAGKTISELMTSHMGMTGLVRELGVGVKNIFDIARIQSEKEAYIRAATSTEREFQVKNAALAISKTNKIFESFAKSLDKAFDDKKINLSGLSLTGMMVANYEDKKSELEKFDKNMELLKKMSSSKDFIVKQVAEKTPMFNAIPSVHLEYMNALNNLIDKMGDISASSPSKKMGKFIKMPFNHSINDMIKLNNKMKVIKNPYIIVDDLSKGMVSLEHMKIAEAVYPATVQKIKAEITKKLINTEDKEMSYKDRIALSLFLGNDIDGSMQYVGIFNQSAELSHNEELNQQTKQLKLGVNKRSPAQQIGEA